MSVLLTRWREWWARVFGRTGPAVCAPEPAPAERRVGPGACPETPVVAVAEIGPGRTAGAGTEPRAAADDALAGHAAQSLLETVQLGSLDEARVVSREVDPKVRQRTLAALDDLRQIPALQSLAQGFLQALSRPEVSVEEVVETIGRDSALCVRILRMANSVLVSPERRIEDLDTAVQMLGVMRVRKAAQALFTLRDANRVAEGFDWRHLWIHALATAAIAEELERELRAADDSQIHLAALLHDVGKIVLSTLAPDDYRDVLVMAWNDGGRLEDLERARLGVDHREAGVVFARHNGLPPIVVEAIAHHERPGDAEKYRLEVALISLANYLSKAHGLGFSGARLEASDGEFETHAAWQVVEQECGGRPNVEAMAAEMDAFVGNLRVELRGLREAAR